MKNIYIDLCDFSKPENIVEGLTSYANLKNSSKFFVKGDGLEFKSLDDYQNIIRRNKFNESDLNNITFQIKSYEDFMNYRKDPSKTYLRILDDTQKNRKSIFIFYQKTIEKNSLLSKIEDAKNFYLKHIDQNKQIKLGIIEKYENDNDILSLIRTLPEFNEIISIKDIITNNDDIVLIDDELTFYVFSLLSTYSRFIKKEKDIKSYFAKFSPFGYQKTTERQVDLDTYFSQSMIEIDEEKKIVFYIKNDSKASEVVSVLDFINSLKSN